MHLMVTITVQLSVLLDGLIKQLLMLVFAYEAMQLATATHTHHPLIIQEVQYKWKYFLFLYHCHWFVQHSWAQCIGLCLLFRIIVHVLYIHSISDCVGEGGGKRTLMLCIKIVF